MKSQDTQIGANASLVELQLRFAQLRADFKAMGISAPMAIIEWRRPALSEDQRADLRSALAGRVVKRHAALIGVVEQVLNELRNAA